MNVYFDSDYVASGHSFDTTRKAGWVADSLVGQPIGGVTLVAPEPLTWEDIERVHSPEYVDAVRTGRPRSLAESQGFTWDPELPTMVLASNGGAVAAARDALVNGVSGSLSSGMHHAKYDEGEGFCTFNGLALAATDVLARGAKSVLILDFDAHCGGGTASLLGDDPRVEQLDIAVNSFDDYPTAQRAVFRLQVVRRAVDYLPTIEQGLADLEAAGRHFDLCLYNAGMDPHEGCTTGGLSGITTEILAQRERLVFAWCRRRALPVAFVLAGGYIGRGFTVDELVGLHRATLAEAAGPRVSAP